MPADRRLETAELLSIGSELTVGETRDTNAGDLARSLTGIGIAVGRIQALPDELGDGPRGVRGEPPAGRISSSRPAGSGRPRTT